MFRWIIKKTGQSAKQRQGRLANKERSFKMKNAKRFLSLILVLAMMLSSGITLYAGGVLALVKRLSTL